MNKIITLAITALIFLLSTGAVYCGETATVIIKDFQFQPKEITVKVGTTIRWENQEDSQYHSILFTGMSDKKHDYFFPNDSRERTFDKPGTYPYICEPHCPSYV